MMQSWHESWAREAYRVLKPGGHLLAFGGTRTYHRLACAIEDAGFEIRDTLCWLYGSGFPKSLDVSKAMDKAAGVERADVGPYIAPDGRGRINDAGITGGRYGAGENEAGQEKRRTAPATDLARQWDGWGTALKPAFEPIVVARKPLVGTVAVNVARYGTGALNVDATRIGETKDVPASNSNAPNAVYGDMGNRPETRSGMNPNLGRWPANVVLDEDAAALLDKQSGILAGGGASTGTRKFTNTVFGHGLGWSDAPGIGKKPPGGASRFFYTAKASRAERNAGLDGMPARQQGQRYGTVQDARPHTADDYEYPRTGAANHHPTVKPIALMRWLVRLVTPPDGLILDPFLGSGTTGIAAVLEGFHFIGIEQDETYLDIARRRIAHWQGPLFAQAEAAD
jgi:site-specific DNA-methyltransferase (adenine-specific)